MGWSSATVCSGGSVSNGSGGCACPSGMSWNGTQCVSQQATVTSPTKQMTEGVCVGNPINTATGVKSLTQEDYAASGLFGVSLTRTYLSKRANVGTTPGGDGLFGPHWRTNFDRRVYVTPAGDKSYVFRTDGRVLEFRLVGGAWTTDGDTSDRLSGSGAAGWQYTSGDVMETYDSSGRLISINQPNGLTQTLTYNAQGKLATVTDPVGRTLIFGYHTNGFVSSVTHATGTFTYAYDVTANLTSVTYPDAKVRTYHYNESTLTGGANLPRALTGVTDERGNRFASYSYDAQGRGTRTEHAGGVDRNTLTYATNATTVVDALNASRTYQFQVIQGVSKCTAVTGAPTPSHPAAQTYDANGYATSRTDWNGNRTNLTHNTRGLETLRVEGLTSAGATIAGVTRTITTEWDANYRLPTRMAEPLRRTTMTYGAPGDANLGNRGSLLTRTVQATTDTNGSLGFGATLSGTARTWTYTYNANGQVLTVNGPRTDVTDVTTYAYYANTATCTATVAGASTIGCRGQVSSVTNAASHVTTINEYNVHGQPLKVTDANGLVTTLAYDVRERLTSRNRGGETTSYTYDNAGLLTRVTLPDASFLAYTYDTAQRLTQIADNLNNKIVYTLDLAGNRTVEEVKDPANALTQKRSRVFSNLNRLSQEIGAASQTTAFAYDLQGNLTSVDGPLAGTVDVTTNAYDALNRLIRITQPGAGQVNYGYSGLDQVTSVSDPRTLKTTYAYDGLDNLAQQVSPDTGTTNNTYDAAGNLLTSTDAKGQQTKYTYDALNRVTKVEYFAPGPVLSATHTFTWDGGTNQKGRLTGITEPSSTTTYAYDVKGRLLSETRTINAIAYVTSYLYDGFGRLTRVTYPGGRQVNYTLDGMGRVLSIATTKGATTQTVLSSTSYRPFGPFKAFTFGNAQPYTRGFDQDGRVTTFSTVDLTFTLGYDAASRILTIKDSDPPPFTWTNNTYGYDTLDRLTSYSGTTSSQSYTYDAVGNRRTKTMGAATATYNYPTTSNRLSGITGATVRNYIYDATGNPSDDDVSLYTYDTRRRVTRTVNAEFTTDYKVNALGQRIRKTNTLGDIVYHWDAQGRLISESTAAGVIRKEYIYLGDTPVAVLQ